MCLHIDNFLSRQTQPRHPSQQCKSLIPTLSLADSRTSRDTLPPSNLGLPTKVVKGGRRLAFKSTLIKRQQILSKEIY